MPSRPHTLLIVAFWVATMSWLGYRDLRPILLPGQPPPYTIDLADEAQAHVVRWQVYQHGRPKGYATTGAPSLGLEVSCHAVNGCDRNAVPSLRSRRLCASCRRRYER